MFTHKKTNTEECEFCCSAGNLESITSDFTRSARAEGQQHFCYYGFSRDLFVPHYVDVVAETCTGFYLSLLSAQIRFGTQTWKLTTSRKRLEFVEAICCLIVQLAQEPKAK